jgi:hypothetical protein
MAQFLLKAASRVIPRAVGLAPLASLPKKPTPASNDFQD